MHRSTNVMSTMGLLGALTSIALLPGAALAQEQLPGIDVSNHQGSIDWNAVAASGQRFAIVLATDGSNFVNPRFDEQYNGSKGVGLYTGTYHFARPSMSSGVEQADYFLDRAQFVADGRTLPPALDLEAPPNGQQCHGLSPASMVAWIREFVGRVKERTGRDALIYVGASWWRTCTGGDTSFAANPLWIVDVNNAEPVLAAGWSTWTFWQYGTRQLDGIPENETDVDRLNGGEDVLVQLAGAAPIGPDGCTDLERGNANRMGCGCKDHQPVCAPEPVGSDGCTDTERANANRVGCDCHAHEPSGGFCPVIGDDRCTDQERANANRVGCDCHAHQPSGGFCPVVGDDGCTDEERANANRVGCDCHAHQPSGGFCPLVGNDGCTDEERANANRVGCDCHAHQPSGGFCPLR